MKFKGYCAAFVCDLAPPYRISIESSHIRIRDKMDACRSPNRPSERARFNLVQRGRVGVEPQRVAPRL